ncbi:MAG: hypothetical protein NXY57DRAFT_1044782, partial [Lentinula lateritia]
MSLRTNPPRKADNRPTKPTAACAHGEHIFDKDDVKDQYHDTNKNKYRACKDQPCPNRYDKITTGYIPGFGRLIDRKQEDLILGRGAPPEQIASSSSQKPQGTPEAAPTPEPEYSIRPPLSPVLDRPSSPTSSLPRSSPPPPDLEDPDPGAEVSDPESDDDDDNMSKVFKAFDKVSTLKSDGSNWDTWKNRVELATQSIGFSDHLTSNPNDDTEALEAKKDDNGNLLNAIVGRLSDQIYRRYKNYDNVFDLWKNLLSDFDSK